MVDQVSTGWEGSPESSVFPGGASWCTNVTIVGTTDMMIVTLLQAQPAFDTSTLLVHGVALRPITQVAITPEQFKEMARTFVGALAGWTYENDADRIDDLKELLAGAVDEARAGTVQAMAEDSDGTS